MIDKLLKDIRYSDWDHEPEFRWQEDAACRFQPWSLFEVAFEGDLIAKDLSANEIKDLNAANFEAAKKICDTCPVWDTCYTTAKPEDFLNTMRAGIIPLRHNSTKKGRPPKDLDGPCFRGHSEWAIHGGRRRCNACEREQQAERACKKRELAEPKPPRKLKVGIKRGVSCRKGHDDWELRKRGASNGPGSHHCVTCKRETDAKHKRSVREAAMAAKLAS